MSGNEGPPDCVLEVVAFTLRNIPGYNLDEFGQLLSNFLGPDPSLSLPEACNFDSTKLLHWMFSVSAPSIDKRTPGFKFVNYIRSEPGYDHWQFRRVLEVAVDRNKVEIAEWAFHHFSGTHVPVEIVETAAKKGRLEILQAFLAHDLGRNCHHHYRSVDGDERFRCSVPDITDEVAARGCWVYWGGGSIHCAVEYGHSDVALWLHQCAPYDSNISELEGVVFQALYADNFRLAQYFLPPRKSLLDYAQCSPRLRSIELTMERGVFWKHQECAANALLKMATMGRLDLMHQAAEHFDHPLVHRTFDWGKHWYSAITQACVRGDLPMTRWLAEHQKGQTVCSLMNTKPNINHLLCFAAEGGNVDVMQYLFDHHHADEFAAALNAAVCKGKLDAVKWLINHLPQADRSAAPSVIEQAAKHGRVEILQYLNDLDASVRRVPISKRKRTLKTNSWWTTAMNWAAGYGNLAAVEWLHWNRSEGCTTKAVDEAAANGHLDVVKWLHANRSEGSTTAAIDGAAASGHLEIVKWLHQNTSAGCTNYAMDMAAGRGHFEVLKWLHANRSEGCSAKAIINAVEHSHARVACWLQKHFAQYVPDMPSVLIREPNEFEMLLFLYAQYPDTYGGKRSKCCGKSIGITSYPNGNLAMEWLKARIAARSASTSN